MAGGRRRTPRSGSAPGRRGGDRRRRPGRDRNPATPLGAGKLDRRSVEKSDGPRDRDQRSPSTPDDAPAGASGSSQHRTAATSSADQRELGQARRRSGLTTRAIALGVVFLLLTISYASSLRVFFDQKREIAATEAEISQRQDHIEDLQSELERWKDPAYVRAQARERLGWVVPGEVGYRVVGPDGKPIVPGAEVEAKQGSDAKDTWWQKLEGSVRAADGPAPAEGDAQPTEEPTAPPRTVGPSSSSTPR